jgi:thiamine-phosphate pyrophosphorylase
MQPTNEQGDAFRILDANANRAAEGLRVVEDFVRFILDDALLARTCKEIRHQTSEVLRQLDPIRLAAARDSLRDVGLEITTESEYQRTSTRQVAQANLKRVQQAMRSLEEFAKTIAPDVGRKIERLRYECYTLEKAILANVHGSERLQQAKLYVLIDGAKSLDDFQVRTQTLVRAGVHVLQLRDKQLDDRRLLDRARSLRETTRGTDTLFVMNDRPDLAVLADADGVHVGQEELQVKDARRIVGVDMLVGVSTHSIEQARQAVLDGAGYIGVGPVFPSETKSFEEFPGLDLLGKVSAEISLPTFAIGGITAQNVEQILAAGCHRVALSSSVWGAADPAQAAAEMLDLLQR